MDIFSQIFNKAFNEKDIKTLKALNNSKAYSFNVFLLFNRQSDNRKSLLEFFLQNNLLPKAFFHTIPSWLNSEILETLIENKYNINEIDEDGDTLLHCLIINEFDYEMSKILIDANTDIFIKNNMGKTPFDILVENGLEKDIDLAKLYIDMDAPVKFANLYASEKRLKDGNLRAKVLPFLEFLKTYPQEREKVIDDALKDLMISDLRKTFRK